MTNDKQRERLVELLVDSETDYAQYLSEACDKAINGDVTVQLMKRMEFYADRLLADGVIVPPVKYGDNLYIITDVSKTIVETIVIGVWIYEESFTVLTIHGNILNDSFGKTVFLTKEEAEEALGGVQ